MSEQSSGWHALIRKLRRSGLSQEQWLAFAKFSRTICRRYTGDGDFSRLSRAEIEELSRWATRSREEAAPSIVKR